jgi:tetratricopeptide (TPR) repeat protein
MPRYAASDIPHVAATDHRIVRRRDPDRDEADRRFPVVFGRKTSDEPELTRDRGVGLARLASAGKGDPIRFAGRALELLAERQVSPGDVAAVEARGHALIVLGRTKEALAAFEEILELAPRRETALHMAALLAQRAGLREKALEYWRRVVAVNPWGADYRANLATLLVHSRAWEEAHDHTRTWVRLDPASRAARELWIRCLRQKGDHESAKAQEEILRRLR